MYTLKILNNYQAGIHFVLLLVVSPVHKAGEPGVALPGVSDRDALAIQGPADGGGRIATGHALQREGWS